MVKILINEQQANYLLEQVEIDREENDNVIVKDFKDVISWFDYMPDDLRSFFKSNPYNYTFEKAMMETMDYLNNKYDLKRVVIKDKNEVVGMLIYSYTTKDSEGIENDEVEEDEQYPVLLAAAVKPEYRQKGLLKMMITNAPVKHPFLVHTSQVSTPKVWSKLGCKIVQDLSTTHGPGNAIELCNEELLKEHKEIYSIKELAKIIAERQWGDPSITPIFLDELKNAYRHSGDEGVIYKFREITSLSLEPISHGKYIFKH